MILILLSTYNGEKYLKEQLDSLFAQTYQDIKIIARDDGSSDATVKILRQYNIELIVSNQNLGIKKSFNILLEYAINKYDSKYFMFCDQDDIWEEDKVEKTLKKMLDIEEKYLNKPILIHTDLKVVNQELQLINSSFWNYEKINPKLNSLNRLLLQNTITGCTIMINKELAKLSLPILSKAIMHDWGIGLVASKFGKISYLEYGTIKYRQHRDNDTGAEEFNFRMFIKKFNILSLLDIDKYILQANAFLNQYKNKLDEDTIKMLEDFVNIKSKSFWQRRRILLKYKLLKQGFIRNLGLFLKI